jgi:serine/threonine protein kinase
MTLRSIKHNNIIRYYELYRQEDLSFQNIEYYILMDFAQNGNLENKIQNQNSFLGKNEKFSNNVNQNY